MAEKEYIERERIKKFFDGIYDCADLTFEPNDHCCAADDCSHCKWHETKNAIKKRILSIPAADVRSVVRAKWSCKRTIEHDGAWYCTACNKELTIYMGNREDRYAFCPYCGADMREES